MKKTTKSPREFLRGLGASVEEVAATLRRRHIVGARKSYTDCPIAVILADRFGDVLVRVRRISFGRFPDMATPPVIRGFLRAFDRGRFPDLETS